jgi:hypothetical protein
MSYGLRPYGVSPYGLVNTSAPVSYTLAVDPASYAVTFPDVGLRVGRKLVVDTAAYAVTFPNVGLEYTPTDSAAVPARPRRKRRVYGDEEGNRNFLGKRGVAENEMAEVMAEIKAKVAPIAALPTDDDDDEEAILWLI